MSTVTSPQAFDATVICKGAWRSARSRGTSCLYLGDVGESNEVRDETDYRNEDLLPGSQDVRIFIHQGCNEPLHGAELWQKIYTKDMSVSI